MTRARGPKVEGFTKREVAAHYRLDGAPKRGHKTVDAFRVFDAGLDRSRPDFVEVDHVYRCALCGLLHASRIPLTEKLPKGFFKQRFMEQDPLRLELGARALAHLGSENWGDRQRRSHAITRRGFSAERKARKLVAL